jgi:hypothetical protein
VFQVLDEEKKSVVNADDSLRCKKMEVVCRLMFRLLHLDDDE